MGHEGKMGWSVERPAVVVTVGCISMGGWVRNNLIVTNLHLLWLL